MSSEHPPEEAELQRPVGYVCIHCEGWKCRRCVPLEQRVAELETELRTTKLAEEVWRRQANDARAELAGARSTLETMTSALEVLQAQLHALEGETRS